MKKVSKWLAAALCLTMVLTLVGCNKYNSVQKVFEDNGFTHSNTLNSMFDAVTKDMEKENIVVTPHVFTKDIICVVVVLEFKSNADIDKALEGSESLKGLLKDLSKSDCVNGNCLCIPVTPSLTTSFADILAIFQKA